MLSLKGKRSIGGGNNLPVPIMKEIPINYCPLISMQDRPKEEILNDKT